MKSRERNFLITAPLIFMLVWLPIMALIETAKGVGDASIEVNSALTALVPALVVTVVYACCYYFICGLAKFLENRTKINRDKLG